MNKPLLMPAAALIAACLAPAPLVAQIAAFEDVDQLDAQVAQFLGAGIGEPGGALRAIDNRLRLKRCPEQVEIERPSPRYATVRCAAINWRIRVPTAAQALAAAPQGAAVSAPAAAMPEIVQRGTLVQLVIDRGAFLVTAEAEAMESGVRGQEIKVRLADSRAVHAARIVGPSKVVLATD